MIALRELDAKTYRRHPLHDEERTWVETNCYVDLWIEVLHAFGFDPTAALAFTVAIDFEGDQWLFFKQPTADLLELYGVDVQELNIFGDFLGHAQQQLERGRIVLVELDAHYLPDTAGVTYRSGHSKTTIGIQSLDVERKKLGYFHNAGYFELEGEDFMGLFGLDRARRPEDLVPYTEFAKFRGSPVKSEGELVQLSLGQLRRHLARRPTSNPIAAFAQRFSADLAGLRASGPEAFHLYAFATLRQFGAAFDLTASYLAWLEGRGERGLTRAREAFAGLASQAKTLQFKTARSVMLKRDADFTPMLDEMQSSWETAMGELIGRYAR